MSKYLCVGMGATNFALASSVLESGDEVMGLDDNPTPEMLSTAGALNFEILKTPEKKVLSQIARNCDFCVPAPGLPDSHSIYKSISGRKLLSELDYASDLTNTPMIAITGTNGKSTVVDLVAKTLDIAGHKAVIAGNADTALSEAVRSAPGADFFVVEASSFGLRHTKRFAPLISAWLNFETNHLDKHLSLKAYRQSKAKIWANLTSSSSWAANKAEPEVMSSCPKIGRGAFFGTKDADFYYSGGAIYGPENFVIAKEELWRSLNHDLLNAQAAAAVAFLAGVENTHIAKALKNYGGLEHRIEKVLSLNDVDWYNDSKATTPHATKAAVSSFDRVVLIAGGRQKTDNLSELKGLKSIKALVAIGEAASELQSIFEDLCPVRIASDMKEAVVIADELSEPQDAVLFSPACASFDWYESFEQRGADFKRKVQELVAGNKR